VQVRVEKQGSREDGSSLAKGAHEQRTG